MTSPAIPKQTIRRYLLTQGVDWSRAWRFSYIDPADSLEKPLDIALTEYRATIRTGERATSLKVLDLTMVPTAGGSGFSLYQDGDGYWWVKLALGNEDTEDFPPRTLYMTIERRWTASGQEDNILGQIQFIVAPSTTLDAEDDNG